MNGVLRIALCYFAMVPVQRWLNWAGLLLLALAVAALAMGDAAVAGSGFILTALGIVFIALTPAVGGGIAMRMASTPSLLHLRPHGRLRLLAGSTLAITVAAALFALPPLAMDWFLSTPGRSIDGRNLSPLAMFEGAWTVLALVWIFMFAISRSMLLFALIGLVPVVAVNTGNLIAPLFPSVTWVFALGIIAWALFALWYLRTKVVHRPRFFAANTSAGFDYSPFARITGLGAPKGELARPQATYFYLFGVASPAFFVFIGAWVAVLFLLITLLTGIGQSRGGVKGAGQLLLMLPFFSFFGASLGYSTARRARFLWLRTGMDRSSLFGLAERWGLRATLTAWSTAGVMVIAFALISQPERTAAHLLFVLVQAAMATAMYYAGLAAVRDWSLGEVLSYIGIGVLFIFQAMALVPMQGAPLWVLASALLVAGLLIAVLRSHARRRWRGLDWRVARVSNIGMGV